MNLKDYFKHFDNTFNTNITNNISIDKFPMLNLAFNNLGEYFYNLTDEHKQTSKIIGNKETEFMEVLNEKQKELFEDYLEAQNISVSEIARQFMVFGYSIAYQELKELGALK